MRFEQTNFATTVQNVLDAVEELDQIFTNEMGLAREPWRNDEEVNRDSIRKIEVLESLCSLKMNQFSATQVQTGNEEFVFF